MSTTNASLPRESRWHTVLSVAIVLVLVAAIVGFISGRASAQEPTVPPAPVSSAPAVPTDVPSTPPITESAPPTAAAPPNIGVPAVISPSFSLTPEQQTNLTRASMILETTIVGKLTISASSTDMFMDGPSQATPPDGSAPQGSPAGMTRTIPINTTGTCTAWFAHDHSGYVGTAGHCVNEETISQEFIDLIKRQFGGMGAFDPTFTMPQVNMTIDSLAFEVVQPASIPNRVLDVETPIKLIGSQTLDQGDNALLKLDNFTVPADITPMQVAASKPNLKDRVMVVGYSGYETTEATNPIVVSDADIINPTETKRDYATAFVNPSFKDGTIDSFQNTRKGTGYMEVGAALTQGMSGGFAVNAIGEVVGVASYMTVTQPFNFITDTDTMRGFFASNGLTNPAIAQPPADAASATVPTAAATNNTDVLSIPHWLAAVVLLALAMLLVATIVAFIAWLRYRRNKRTKQQPGTDASVEESDNDDAQADASAGTDNKSPRHARITDQHDDIAPHDAASDTTVDTDDHRGDNNSVVRSGAPPTT